MKRRTKIVCTLGPASSDRETIQRLVDAGMDVARMNFSHGSHDEHMERIEHVRAASKQADRTVTIMQDLQGPKIRVGSMKDGGVMLHQGDELVLTSDPIEEGTAERVHIDYPTLAEDVDPGGRVLLDDGLLELKVTDVSNGDVRTKVVIGGPLRSRKGVNLPHIRTSTPSMTDKDLKDLEFGLDVGVDIVALSFVRTADDVQKLARRIDDAGRNTSIIAKIEKPEAVDNIDAILNEVDGIMVARGDMGIEMAMEKVPSTQKFLIRQSLQAAAPVITATEMLESMIENPRPTRAEASDVANAVLDGSDAVMLSGETAVGRHPVRVVRAMNQIIQEAESHRWRFRQGLDNPPGRLEQSGNITRSVSFTACRLAEQVGAKAIACLTNSGATARSIARHRPSMPIHAFTDNQRVVGRLGVLWGTEAFHIPFQDDTDRGIALVHQVLKDHHLVEAGDLVVITAGMPLPARGRTNMVHVSRIKD
jgi:pyruvate kinase